MIKKLNSAAIQLEAMSFSKALSKKYIRNNTYSNGNRQFINRQIVSLFFPTTRTQEKNSKGNGTNVIYDRTNLKNSD